MPKTEFEVNASRVDSERPPLSATQHLEAAGATKRDGATGDRPLNVMLLASSLERGGAERQVVALANNLDREQFKVHVGSLSTHNPLAEDLRDLQHHLFVVPRAIKYDVSLIWRMARLLRQLKIDVIHSFLFDAEIVGRLAGRLARVPAVICSNRCVHLERSRFKLWVARATGGLFDMMIANSHTGLEFERDQRDVPASKLCAIPNGVDVARFAPRDASVKRRELGIADGDLVVGMFAHFSSKKNHRMFIEAAKQVIEQVDSAVFLCVGAGDGGGHGPLIEAARDATRRHGIQDRVRFLGERTDVAALYNVCDIKVLASTYEGTPNVVLEAMASGLPVIATNVSDNARIVQDGQCGYIVPPDDSPALADRLVRLLQSESLRHQMGEAARARVIEEYSLGSLASRTGRIYQDVVAAKRKR